ncbi:MAG: hypothetical protein QXF46_03300 [Thermofilaceae archaeon]
MIERCAGGGAPSVNAASEVRSYERERAGASDNKEGGTAASFVKKGATETGYLNWAKTLLRIVGSAQRMGGLLAGGLPLGRCERALLA